MTLTLRLLGLELIYLELTTDPPETETEAEHESPSGGYTTASPVGFAAFEVPDMVGLPNRDNGYGDGE